jgi:hypothetical protein
MPEWGHRLEGRQEIANGPIEVPVDAHDEAAATIIHSAPAEFSAHNVDKH